jgi:predicted ATP-dependent endonuclease of OLD family
MPVIYIDNFRGFENTFLPLKNINFFVGENSTGKTSVLKLIRVLNDFKFWISLNFNTEDTELGYFSEIASYSNPRKKYFVIGILGDEIDKHMAISAIKMKFTSQDGIPFMSELNFIEKGINVHAIVSETSIKYRYQKINVDQINENNKLKYFQFWIKNNGLKNKTFKTIELKESFMNQAFLQLQFILFKELKIEGTFGYRMPFFMSEIAWLAPIRTAPKRTYDKYTTAFSPEGTHAPYVLKKLLTGQKDKNITKKVEAILTKFGTDSGLFDRISINQLGKSDTAPFEVLIFLEDKPIKITSVGYGVSQILPLIIEIISRPNNSWFAIQQPEIHLHPKAQAAFGDFIFKSYQTERKCFIIETHSDFTIDRFRTRIGNLKEKEEFIDSQVIYFHRENGVNHLSCIIVNKDGSYADNQPKEFRDFFIKEQINLLNI